MFESIQEFVQLPITIFLICDILSKQQFNIPSYRKERNTCGIRLFVHVNQKLNCKALKKDSMHLDLENLVLKVKPYKRNWLVISTF